MNRKRTLKIVLLVLLAVLSVPFVVPERGRIPVQGATVRDWNPRSFWYEPWGASGVHKGIDIFAPTGREVMAPVPGIVIYQGKLGMGGNVVAMLGPGWRIHYFAHLSTTQANIGDWLSRGEVLGRVGTSGNAAGKPPHLHYAVLATFPRFWKLSPGTQGWKRMFFVDPGDVIGRA
ncbi:MAG TPA: M23 family metallopeptidase [Povalibacter sp.]|nr:M23 family metallopeptidase [Povalibacter sp.]